MTTWTLGLDTSTDICLGLARDGELVAAELVADRRGHAEKLMPAVVELCRDHGIAVSDMLRQVRRISSPCSESAKCWRAV